MPEVATQTPKQELLELKLGEPLAPFVDQRRRAFPQWSWQNLADELHDRTGVRVSHEWLRVRFREAD